MINGTEDEESFSRQLGRWDVFVYGVGHMLNDITSACWFTYLLVFLTDIGLSPGYGIYCKLLHHIRLNSFQELNWSRQFISDTFKY